MILVGLIFTVWVLVTLEGWTWERPAPTGPLVDRSPGWALHAARPAPGAVVPWWADPRPIVTAVQRWDDLLLDNPCAATVRAMWMRRPAVESMAA